MNFINNFNCNNNSKNNKYSIEYIYFPKKFN